MVGKFFKGTATVLSLLLVAVVSYACGGGDADPPMGPDDNDDPLLANEVDASGGTVQVASGNVSIAIPAGAVSAKLAITASATTGPASDVAVGGSTFDLGPNGTQFASPVTLTLSYNPASLPGEVREGELQLNKVIDGVWTLIAGSTVNEGANTVSGQINSFSVYGILGQEVGSVTISPATADLDLGGTTQFTGTAVSVGGVGLERTVVWTSSAEGVATVDANGVVTAEGEGEATITATVGAFSATATVTVTIPVASVEVSPATAALQPGQTAQLTATPKDVNGNELDRAVVWTSSDEGVATVDANGLVTVQGLGTATITATSGGVSGTATVTVTDSVELVSVTDGTPGLLNGGTEQLGVTATRASGADVANPSATWSTSDEEVATVDANGLVTSVAPGVVTISATVEGVVGTFDITVTIDWTTFAGTWTGTWLNTTFSSTDAVSWVVTIDIPTLAITIVLDMDGPVFGLSNPAPITINGTLGATTASGSVNAPLHGPVTLTAAPDNISIQSTNVPAAGIDAWTSNGAIANGVYNGTFTIAFTGGGGAQGTTTLTQQGG